ncbi:MAG: hypothetical protein KME22_24460 [Hassallia sp. WJT32-NPBG1]|nr:hypothetical protein [Hassallia sp. WJT32-NPBG1]
MRSPSDAAIIRGAASYTQCSWLGCWIFWGLSPRLSLTKLYRLEINA